MNIDSLARVMTTKVTNGIVVSMMMCGFFDIYLLVFSWVAALVGLVTFCVSEIDPSRPGLDTIALEGARAIHDIFEVIVHMKFTIDSLVFGFKLEKNVSRSKHKGWSVDAA